MKQPNNRNLKETTAALYPRLSRDDNLEGDSYSIQNQKKLLAKVAKEKGYTNLLYFVDDGISGVTMDRPGFKEMLAAIEAGRVGAVIVKDLSRLGRNYIEVGRLTEEYFPEHDIRLIAVSDAIDTAEGENELTPIRNLFNEWYARDISKKRRMSNYVKGRAGDPLSQPPYGYIKDPENPNRWVVEDEAAAVVRRIFQMSVDGFGTEQIATALERDKILVPVHYWLGKGVKRPNRNHADTDPCHWRSSTIIHMLGLQEYCGDVINFKTYSKSYKNKKRLPNEPDNMAVFTGVHEPVIDRSVWEKVQAKRGKARKRKSNEGERNMFSGLVVCADCGHNLWYHFNQGNPEIRYFNCSNYKGNRGTCSSTHYVRVDFLENVVQKEIRRLTKFAVQYEDEFATLVMGHSQKVVELDRQLKQKEMYALTARDKELDKLFNRMYEDNASGKIDDARFAKMSRQYAEEQASVVARLKDVRDELEKKTSKAVSTEAFIATVRKYTRAKKLSARMLNELIEKIEVFQAEKPQNEHKQKLRIHFVCVGSIEIPDVIPLPEPEIRIETRKGVAINYSCAQKAV